MPSKQRYDVLDGLRGVAAIVVMFFHYTHFDSFLSWKKFIGFSSAGLAVDFFFMLSGFVLTHSYQQKLSHGMSDMQYFLRRYIRLYPMFLLGLLVGTPVLFFLARAGHATYSLRSIIGCFILNAAGMPFLSNFSVFSLGGQTIGEIFPGNPPAWSLFFEMFVSLVFIYLARIRFRRLLLIAAFSFVFFMGFGMVSESMNHHLGVDFGPGWGSSNFIGGFPRVLYGFTLGMILYRLCRSKYFYSKLHKLIPFDLNSPFAAYFVFILILFFPHALKGIYPLLFLTVLAPYLLAMGARITCKGVIETRITQLLGWLSYPVYCLHYPIGRIVWLIGEKYHASSLLVVGGSICATMVAATLLTKWVEEPVRKYLSAQFL